MRTMNEKEFIRDIIERKHGTKALEMSAEDVLNKRTSSGSLAKGRGFAIPAVLAAVALTGLAVGGTLLLGGDKTPTSDEAEDIKETTTVTSASYEPTFVIDDKTEVKDPKVTSAPEQDAPDFTTTTVTVPDNSNDPNATVKSDQDTEEKRVPMLYDYPTDEIYTYTAPSAGKVELSTPLSKALGEYGGTVNYYLIAEVYKNGELQVKDPEELQKVANKLYELGITAGVERLAGGMGENPYNYLIVFPENEQIVNFPSVEGYGILLRLHGECAKAPYANSGEQGISATWNSGADKFTFKEIKAGDKLKIDIFPNLTFNLDPNDGNGNVIVVSDGDTVKFQNAPVKKAYLSDITGDGYPELCMCFTFGSDIRSAFITVYECKTGKSYGLGGLKVFLNQVDPYDYYLTDKDGQLYAERVAGDGQLTYKDPVRGRLAIKDGELKFTPISAITEIKPNSTVKLDVFPNYVFDNANGTLSISENGNFKMGLSVEKSAYFCDLNNDGYPEVCAASIVSSDIKSACITVYDCKNGVSYGLGGDQTFLNQIDPYDYYLTVKDGNIVVERVACDGKLTYKDPVKGTISIKGGELKFTPI